MLYHRLRRGSTTAGNDMKTTRYARHHDDSATGDLDAGIARVGSWYDGAGQPVATAEYGTGALERQRGSTVAVRSDLTLVTAFEYSGAAKAYKTMAPGRQPPV